MRVLQNVDVYTRSIMTAPQSVDVCPLQQTCCDPANLL